MSQRLHAKCPHNEATRIGARQRTQEAVKTQCWTWTSSPLQSWPQN